MALEDEVGKEEQVLCVEARVLPEYLTQDEGGFLLFGGNTDSKFFPLRFHGRPVRFDIRRFLQRIRDGGYEPRGNLDWEDMQSSEEDRVHVTTYDVVYRTVDGQIRVLSGVYQPEDQDEENKFKSNDIGGLRTIGWGGHVPHPKRYLPLSNGTVTQALELTNIRELHEELVEPITMERRRFGVVHTPVDYTNRTHFGLVDLVMIHNLNVELTEKERKNMKNVEWLTVDSLDNLYEAQRHGRLSSAESPLAPWAQALIPALQEMRSRPFAGYGRG